MRLKERLCLYRGLYIRTKFRRDMNITGTIRIGDSQRLPSVQVAHVDIEADTRQVVLCHFDPPSASLVCCIEKTGDQYLHDRDAEACAGKFNSVDSRVACAGESGNDSLQVLEQIAAGMVRDVIPGQISTLAFEERYTRVCVSPNWSRLFPQVLARTLNKGQAGLRCLCNGPNRRDGRAQMAAMSHIDV